MSASPMVQIDIRRVIPAPIDAVFELLSDHGNYQQFRVVKASKLVKEGESSPNGLGATRRIHVGGAMFVEDITAFDPPHSFEYLIREMRPKLLRHLLGRVELKAVDGGTEVHWVSHSDVPVPVIGQWLARKVEQQGTRGFSSILTDIESRLAA